MPLQAKIVNTQNIHITYAEIARINNQREIIPFESQQQNIQAYHLFKNSDLGKEFFIDSKNYRFTISSELSSGIIRNGTIFDDPNEPVFPNEGAFYASQHDNTYSLIFMIIKIRNSTFTKNTTQK
jgi:hypothetical protein